MYMIVHDLRERMSPNLLLDLLYVLNQTERIII